MASRRELLRGALDLLRAPPDEAPKGNLPATLPTLNMTRREAIDHAKILAAGSRYLPGSTLDLVSILDTPPNVFVSDYTGKPLPDLPSNWQEGSLPAPVQELLVPRLEEIFDKPEALPPLNYSTFRKLLNALPKDKAEDLHTSYWESISGALDHQIIDDASLPDWVKADTVHEFSGSGLDLEGDLMDQYWGYLDKP